MALTVMFREVDCASRCGRIISMAGMGACPEVPIGSIYTRDLTLQGFVISTETISEFAYAALRANAGDGYEGTDRVQGSHTDTLVEVSGLEPPTSTLRT